MCLKCLDKKKILKRHKKVGKSFNYSQKNIEAAT